jgi:2-polyprenyl-3-methyl-5-hydroxy-6-metoxy-1,4-benzoquinol methylase
MSNYTNNLFDPNVKNNSWTHLYDYVPQKARVLDVGCSSGNFGEVLRHDKKCEVVGLDIDKADIEKAKKNLDAAYVRNVEKDDLGDLGMFDIIIFADVLEHLLDPTAALEKVKKLLKPKGKILFSIPNMAHISIRLHLLRGFFEYTPIGLLDRTHLHYYDEHEVQHIFSEALLHIEEVNACTKPFAKSQISERLYEMGLGIVDDKFYDVLDRTKADVFQFVGYAVPAKTKQSATRPTRYLMPDEEMHLSMRARDDEVKKVTDRLRVLERENKHMSEFYKNPVVGGAKRIARRVRRAVKGK